MKEQSSRFVYDNTATLRILTPDQVETISQRALDLLAGGHIRVASPEALDLLEAAGCAVDRNTSKVALPEELVRKAVLGCPRSFSLYDREGGFYCEYGDGITRFNPGSCPATILEPDGMTPRESGAADLIRLVRIAQNLESMDFISSSVAAGEAPSSLGSLYLYYIQLLYGRKPMIGGAVDPLGGRRTFRLLEVFRESREDAIRKPCTVFDVCATSPLTWDLSAATNILDCARLGIPMQMVSSSIAGATSPVTLAGALLQHTAEVLSGIVLAQTVRPGAPVAFGGAPCVFDMQTLFTPMASVEADLIVCAYAQMGKYYGLPVHAYAALGDGKCIDYQAGMETARSGLLAMLAGVDNISGPGALNVAGEMSPEKLVLDGDCVLELKRFAGGLRMDEDRLGMEAIIRTGAGGSYLASPHTRKYFRQELPPAYLTLDREDRGRWQKKGAPSIVERARIQAERLAALPPALPGTDVRARLDRVFRDLCMESGAGDRADALMALARP